MIWWLNSAVGKLVEIIFFPVQNFSPWVAMILISLLTALLMLFIYKKTSNQVAIKQVKSQIKASLLELRLYQNDFRTLLSSQKKLLTANWRYLLLNLKPLLIMIIPIFLILAQLNLWFNYKSIQPGETFLLKVKFIDEVDIAGINLDLEAPKGLTIETPVLRILDEREADWRLRMDDQVLEPLIIKVNGQSYQKEIPPIKNSLGRISTIRVKKNLWQELLYPGEKSLPAESVINRIELVYPEQRLNFLGIGIHWLVAYFLLSIIFGLALKRPFKVEI